jgi:hypothetical protein
MELRLIGQLPYWTEILVNTENTIHSDIYINTEKDRSDMENTTSFKLGY